MYGESGKLQTTIYELSFRYPAGFPQEVWPRLERLAGPFVVRKDGWPADFESAMKRVLISVLLGAVIQPALAGELQQSENVHSVVVDIPDLIDMTYASPDTWHNLPPKVELYEQLPVTIPGSNRGQLPTSPRLPTYLAAVQPQ